jgi:hypothetical protein
MLIFALTTVIAAWVIFFDGAEKLEGSLLSIFVVDMLWAPLMSARWLRIFVGFGWLADLIVLLVNHHRR